MEVSQSALFGMLLAGVLLGLVLGVLYDAFRLLRRAVSAAGNRWVPAYAAAWKLPLLGCPGDWKRRGKLAGGVSLTVTVFFDLLFGFVAGIAVLLLLYDRNDGIFRMSAPLGVAAGFFLYRFSVGRLTSAFSDVILFFAGLLFRYLFHFVTLPVRLLLRAVRGGYRRFLAPVIKRKRETLERSRSDRRIAGILKDAGEAFFDTEVYERGGKP